MALFKSEEICAWRYKVQSCVILINGEALTLEPLCITGIEIHNDYFKNTFPIFKVNFLLESDIYYKVYKNKTNLKIKLNIQKYYKMQNSKDKSLYQDYINDTFVTIEDDNDVERDYDLTLQEDIKKSDSSDELDKFDSPLELYLYREETTNGVKTQINEIFKNVTLSSVIGYLFGVSGIKNTLMSPLENNKTYKTLLLPPLTINHMLAHLDAAYGFYKAGSIIFFGIDNTYILNFKGGCTAYKQGERKETCIYIPKITSGEIVAEGTIESDNIKHYLNWNYEQVKFKNTSISSNVINGTDVMVINGTNATKTMSFSKTTTNGKSNTAIIDDEADNPWLGTTFTAQASANATIVYGVISDIDLSALTPNKKFNLIFEDQNLTNKYKGTYLLSNCFIKFLNDTAEGDFKVVSSIELHRVVQTESNQNSMT